MYKYHFDGYLKGKACGWIINLEQPRQRVPLGLFAEGRLVHSGLAELYREDIYKAGIGDGCCGFEIPADIGNQLELEVRVLADGMPIAGSCRSFLTTDDCANRILRSGHFDGYVQFKPENLVASLGPRLLTRHPSRLTRGFSRIVGHHEGVAYTAHMQWLCSRLRRGAPSFFSKERRNALDDLYWYLFECADPSKALAEYALGYLSSAVFPVFAGMEHHTVLLAVWLHRTGRQLQDLRKDGMQAHTDFCHALVAANSGCPPATKLEMQAVVRLSKVLGAVEPAGGLPSITNYLKTKWERRHQDLHRFEGVTGYLLFLFDCCLHAQNAREIEFFGTDVLDFFRAPIALQEGACSRFSLLCFALAARMASAGGANFSHTSAREVNVWFEETWLQAHPLHEVFLMEGQGARTSPSHTAGHACYVVAHWNSPSGLTQNAHMSVKALTDAGLPVVKLLPNGDLQGRMAGSTNGPTVKLKKSLVLLHVNADDAPAALYAAGAQVNLDTAYVVGFFLWELETVPDTHKLGVSLVDEIWAPTQFVATAYRNMGAANVQWVGKGISVPQILAPNREKFQLKAHSIVFLLSFDFHSSIERKNPLATVLAFREAFTNRDDVQLVIKSTPAQPGHWGDPFDQWGQIVAIATSDQRITVIDEFLSDADLFELIACSDVIVSSHRAEGFGYLPAYGLLYGKRVVVTGYGGTADYCNAGNAWLVKFDLVQVPNERFIHPVPGAKWAAIDVQDLAHCMVQASAQPKPKGRALKASPATAKGRTAVQQFAPSGLTMRYIERLRAAKLVAP